MIFVYIFLTVYIIGVVIFTVHQRIDVRTKLIEVLKDKTTISELKKMTDDELKQFIIVESQSMEIKEWNIATQAFRLCDKFPAYQKAHLLKCRKLLEKAIGNVSKHL